MADKKHEEESRFDAQFIHRENVRPLYSDFVNVNIGPHGIKFYFGVAQPHTPPDAPIQIEEQATIGMSLEHAKSLYDLIGKQMELFEKQNGPIREVKVHSVKMASKK